MEEERSKESILALIYWIGLEGIERWEYCFLSIVEIKFYVV